LHEKVKKFEINKNLLYFFGTEMRSYCQYVHEELQHEKRKMQTIYKWRLDRLFREEGTYGKGQKREISGCQPKEALVVDGAGEAASIELVITSETYFLVLTDILELIVVERQSLKIKFTMILPIAHDSKVMKMALGPN
jgi:hypothetical protein